MGNNKIAEDILKTLFDENKLYFYPENKYDVDHLGISGGVIELTWEQNIFIKELHKERYTCTKCKKIMTDLYWNSMVEIRNKKLPMCKSCFLKDNNGK